MQDVGTTSRWYKLYLLPSRTNLRTPFLLTDLSLSLSLRQGIVYFMRVGWAIGQGGIVTTIAILLIAELQAVCTVLSMSALVTNGVVGGGGSYFLIRLELPGNAMDHTFKRSGTVVFRIANCLSFLFQNLPTYSRALGPEFGGAMGLLFYSAYAVSVAFYTIGFATTVQTTWFPTGDFGEAEWYRRAIGSIGLFTMLLVSLAGAGFFARFNFIFFIVRKPCWHEEG